MHHTTRAPSEEILLEITSTHLLEAATDVENRLGVKGGNLPLSNALANAVATCNASGCSEDEKFEVRPTRSVVISPSLTCMQACINTWGMKPTESVLNFLQDAHHQAGHAFLSIDTSRPAYPIKPTSPRLSDIGESSLRNWTRALRSLHSSNNRSDVASASR